MTIIVCVDNRYGMLFAGRRQSQDRLLRQALLDLAGDRPLRMSPYSAKQFRDCPGILAGEDYLQKAGPEDLCFVETDHLLPWIEKIHRMVLCRWNRDYPGDFFLDLIPEGEPWHRISSREIPGSSHETITLEVYEK